MSNLLEHNAEPDSTQQTLLQELIHTRRTHFQFLDTPLPEGALDRALAAAHWAPNHKRTFPWRFMLPGPQMQSQLVEYFAQKLQRKLENRGMPAAEIPDMILKSRARQEKMPLQIIVYSTQTGNAHQNQEDYASTCCAIQNLTLSLWSEGIASGWKTFDNPDAYALTGLNPEENLLVGLIQAGFPRCESIGRRPPLENHIIQTA